MVRFHTNALRGTEQEMQSNYKVWLTLAKTALESIRAGCDRPCYALYSAYSQLERLPWSNIHLSDYEHLFYMNSDVSNTDMFERACNILQLCENKLEVMQYAKLQAGC